MAVSCRHASCNGLTSRTDGKEEKGGGGGGGDAAAAAAVAMRCAAMSQMTSLQPRSGET